MNWPVGGQVYFLHNHIEQLPMVESQLNDLVPGLRVRIAHGQMRATELEDVMLAFYKMNLMCCYARPL